ncbi:flavin reductase [Nocardioides kongjuensis]|uniref:Flavin reductase (NADH) n=1 Tax=Nocardioides kongjuensis TaxID=349522 RepID=A0A852RT69_9ACTN|nr:flavin reductase [Nocardioides kongjuensis]NYD31104.1 flavin reductase (NADH) [Nocardioides kongjuensis]
MTVTSGSLTGAQRAFRAAMAQLSAAVSVITTDGPAGRAGITVSALCSVTDEPPTLLACLNQSSRSHDAFLANRRVCVNLLGPEHEELAMRFAGATGLPMAERFAGEAWDELAGGVPVLRGATANVVGRIVSGHTHGSHSVLMIEVDDVSVAEDRGALVYFQRRFHAVGVAS